MNWLSLFVLLTMAGLAQSQYTCGGSCGYRPVAYSYGNVVYDYGMTRIVGGAGSAVAEWPWLVSIQHPWVPGTKHWCGGSLITGDWVLTAAHCFDKFDQAATVLRRSLGSCQGFLAASALTFSQPKMCESTLTCQSSNFSLLYVMIGATNLYQPGPGAQVRNVKKVVMHRDYRRKDMSYDIALIQLEHPVLCSAYVQLACLAEPTLRVSELRNCWVAGWGATTARSVDQPAHLQQAKVQLIDLQLCNSSDWYSGEVYSYNLCAGYPEGTIDSCKGDSGGPLMCQDNNAAYWWVIGITSWGKGCARAKQPGVYTSVQHFYNWIDYNMQLNAVKSAP